MSLSKNLIYNTIYQIVIMFLPFITIPYISRALGSDAIGVFSFTDSILHYFVVFGILGVTVYGSRAIAYIREDEEKRSRTFWSIFILKLITTTLSTVIFFVTVYNNSTQYKLIYLIQAMNLLATALDISWFFTGIEQIKTILGRNLVIRVTGIALIFLLVKSPEDLWIYTIITNLSNVIGQAVMWAYVPKFIKWVKVSKDDILAHLVPILKLFLVQVASEIYLYLDKTMLGILTTKSEVGIYELSQKLTKIILGLITSMSVIVIPKIANLYANKDEKKIKESITLMFRFINYISVPLCIGLCAITAQFVPWFFGAEYTKIIYITYVTAPMLIIIPWGNIVGVQLMIPMGKEMQVAICPISGAVINVILNFILIPKFASLGAAFASLMAEAVGALIALYMMRNFLPFKKMYSEIWKYFIGGIAMFIVVYNLGSYMGASAITTIVQVIVGMAVYFALMALMKSSMNQFAINKIKDIVFRH